MGLPHRLPLPQVPVQLGGWHVPEQSPLAQSEFALHIVPSLQLGEHPPPVALHSPLKQLPEAQSAGAPQKLPVPQDPEHIGVWHVPPEQIPEPQSALDPQGVVSLHVGAQFGA